jgi:hypothetical protein
MMSRCSSAMIATAVVVALVWLTPAPAAAQASGEGAPAAAPTTTWNPPRTLDGQPDIQGYWQNRGVNSYNLEEGMGKEHLEITAINPQNWRPAIVDPPDGKFPYQPWAAAKRKEIRDHHTNLTKWEYIDPHTLCYLSGIPRVFYQGGFQILQPPGYVVFLQEFNHAYRIVPLDQRPHLGDNFKLWMGDSRGRWEGNTLVVDVTSNNDKTWWDVVGSFHSDALHIVERYTFVDADTINYEATFEDPKVFTRPFKMSLLFNRNKEPGYELIEFACHEGQESQQFLKTLRETIK